MIAATKAVVRAAKITMTMGMATAARGAPRAAAVPLVTTMRDPIATAPALTARWCGRGRARAGAAVGAGAGAAGTGSAVAGGRSAVRAVRSA